MKTIAKSTIKNYAEAIVVHVEHGGHPTIFEYDGAVYFDANSSIGGRHELACNDPDNCEILVDEEVIHDAMTDLQLEACDELSDAEEDMLLDKIAELTAEALMDASYSVI